MAQADLQHYDQHPWWMSHWVINSVIIPLLPA